MSFFQTKVQGHECMFILYCKRLRHKDVTTSNLKFSINVIVCLTVRKLFTSERSIIWLHEMFFVLSFFFFFTFVLSQTKLVYFPFYHTVCEPNKT